MTRARRALAEFRIRGVSTNIPFLQAVLEDEDFIAGNVSTSFIDERPELLTTRAGRPRHQVAALAGRSNGQSAARAGTDPARSGEKRPAGVDLDIPLA